MSVLLQNEGRTPPGDYGCFIPETPKDVYAQRDPPVLLLKPSNVPAPGIGSITQPPQLPTQLLQVFVLQIIMLFICSHLKYACLVIKVVNITLGKVI